MQYLKITLITLLVVLNVVLTPVNAKNDQKVAVDRHRSALISEGAVLVAGYNENNIFGNIISNLYGFVEYGQFDNAISIAMQGGRLAVLTNNGRLSLQGVEFEYMTLIANDVIDFALSSRYLLILHDSGVLTRIALEQAPASVLSSPPPTTAIHLEGGENNIALITESGLLYLDDRFVADNVDMFAVGQSATLYKTRLGKVYLLDNISLVSTQLAFGTDIVNLSVGAEYLYIHYQDGRVLAKDTRNNSKLTAMKQLWGLESIQASNTHALARKGADVYAWGQNHFGQFGQLTKPYVDIERMTYTATLVE